MKNFFITEIQRIKIISFLREYGVVVAYIFGSYARNTAGVLSDIDIGVIFPNNMSLVLQESRVEEIRNGLEKMFGKDKVDIVNVQMVKSPLLRYIITLGEGKILFSDDMYVRNNVADYSRREYEDTRPIREIQHAAIFNMFT